VTPQEYQCILSSAAPVPAHPSTSSPMDLSVSVYMISIPNALATYRVAIHPHMRMWWMHGGICWRWLISPTCRKQSRSS
jgi:hypothetical protein